MNGKTCKKMNNSDKTILHLCCSKLASDSQIYSEYGYNVIKVGLDFGLDVMTYKPPENVYGIIANPPCTMFSIARTKAKTPRDLRQGMETVIACLKIIWECQYNLNGDQRTSNLKFWMIENPATGFLKWFFGNPVFQYSQHEYGYHLTKRTALWGMFNLPKRPILYNPLPTGSTIGKKHEKTKHDMQTRSKCPINFAKAFFEVNP